MNRPNYMAFVSVTVVLWISLSGNRPISPTQGSKDQIIDGKFKIIEIDGTYQGENLLVTNPYMMAVNGHCIKTISINGKPVIQDPDFKKIGVNLAFLGKGEYVNLTIKHYKDCHPRLMNSKALLSNTKFDMVSISVDNDFIQWTTNNEKNQQPFVIEKLLFNKWIRIGKQIANGNEGYSNYKHAVTHHSGVNKYRIKRRDITNYFIYSNILSYSSAKEPVSFQPTRVDDFIRISETCEFKIVNERGVLVLEGNSNSVDASGLAPGVYYMQFDNRTEKFYKN